MEDAPGSFHAQVNLQRDEFSQQDDGDGPPQRYLWVDYSFVMEVDGLLMDYLLQ